MAVQNSLRICTLNLHGFNNSKIYLQELCSNADIICVQEHWLSDSLLNKFSDIHDNYYFYGCSAMNNACSSGILRGRPFGGVGFLCRNSLPVKIGLVGHHTDGRVITVTVDSSNLHILMFCVYLPCDDGDLHYCDCLSDIFGYIESIADSYPGYKCVILGDFNFQCDISHRGFREFMPVMNNLNLCVCDSLDANSVGFTYSHSTLEHKSLIDHVFVNNDLLSCVSNYRIVQEATNLSDHLPILFSLPVTSNASVSSRAKTPVYVHRWDKGDLSLYNLLSGDLLSRIYHPSNCTNSDSACCQSTCYVDIDIYYCEIVHCLTEACKRSIPRLKVSALKHYWNSTLEDLKQQSILAHNLWKSVGSPRSGDSFNLMRDAKYKYKLAIRDAASQFESRFDDDLLVSYLDKDYNTFWKLWKNKVQTKRTNVNTSQIGGKCDDQSIANAFADYCNNSVSNNCADNNSYIFDISSENLVDWLFGTDDVDRVIRSLKHGKAAGLDGISVEHLTYSHPSLISHLRKLFNLIMQHGYVPKHFGSGVVVPILKDRLGDVSSLDNYRAITISNIISKVFESCLLEKFGDFLTSHDLQFGFKKGLGCQNAIFTVQQVTSYFTKHGSTVYFSALDASKAFDRVNHSKLFDKMIERNVPHCFIRVLHNWYSKLVSVVKWNGVFSYPFSVYCGVRQGGVLSPLLFNIYVDDLIHQLEASNYGCYVFGKFFGCIMYADDLLLLSASVTGLQQMLHICHSFAQLNDIIFNHKKICMF